MNKIKRGAYSKLKHKKDKLYMQGIKLQENQKQMVACLEEAYKEGLLFEIVDWALNIIRNNPSQTNSQAIQEGFNEWVK